jgi:hypothetical protein
MGTYIRSFGLASESEIRTEGVKGKGNVDDSDTEPHAEAVWWRE